MIRHIYIEHEVADLPLTKDICARFPQARHTAIERFGEVFNSRSQNFRLQKQQPAAILAKKHGNLILPIPDTFAVGARHNYYFSHAYNCLYDCRYCFLQAMYSSAHYVFFVNHGDFVDAIKKKAAEHAPEPVWFFSGYDCDSLAFEPVTGFAARFVEVFRSLDNAVLELRSKSTAVRSLLATEPCENVVVAMSLSPNEIASQYDHKAPSIHRRLEALGKLAQHGWNVGFRFDPLLWHKDFSRLYSSLCQQIEALVPPAQRHSVTIGELRFPKQQFKRLVDLYPEERLLASVSHQGGQVSYPADISAQMFVEIERILDGFIDRDKVYRMA